MSGKVVVDAWVWSAPLDKKIQTTHDSVTDAKNWQASQRAGRVHGQEVDPKRSKLSFAAIAAGWLMSDPSKETESRKTDRHRLTGTGVRLTIEGEGKETVVTVTEKPEGFAAMAIGRITSADVQELVNGWKTTYTASSVRGMYGAVRATFHYAERSKAIPRRSSPCEDTELPKLPMTPRPVHRPDDADLDDFVGVWSLSNDDLIRLADELGSDNGLMVWIAICLGMRWHEIAGLTVGSVENLLQGEIKVMQALNRQRKLKGPKSLAGDRYFVDRDLAPDIAAHLTRRGSTRDDSDAFLFVNSAGQPLSYSSWRDKFWLPALRKAGLAQKKPNGQYLGLHDLRSMNASIMEHQGVDGVTARFRRGHSVGQDDDRMAAVYIRTMPRQNRLASEKIHSVVRRQPRAAG